MDTTWFRPAWYAFDFCSLMCGEDGLAYVCLAGESCTGAKSWRVKEELQVFEDLFPENDAGAAEAVDDDGDGRQSIRRGTKRTGRST